MLLSCERLWSLRDSLLVWFTPRSLPAWLGSIFSFFIPSFWVPSFSGTLLSSPDLSCCWFFSLLGFRFSGSSPCSSFLFSFWLLSGSLSLFSFAMSLYVIDIGANHAQLFDFLHSVSVHYSIYRHPNLTTFYLKSQSEQFF